MIVIIHYADGTSSRWEGITKIERDPKYAITDLYRDKERVKQTTCYIRLEVI